MDYKVKFEVFEGPLDLLLYLIKKEEVDIYEVNLTKLATQFIEYIDLMRMLDLDVAGEFLVMASTLMYIKSRELLPVDQQVVAEEEEEGVDPRWELIRQLVEYKKFKDAAAQLQTLEIHQESIYPRLPVKPEFDAKDAPLRTNVSLFDLINAVSLVLKRVQAKEDTRDIFQDKWTVSEKIEFLMQSLKERAVLRFSDLFASATSRSEVVVTFLAMLELIRLGQLAAVQKEAFGEIEIVPAEPRATPPPSSPPEGQGAETPTPGEEPQQSIAPPSEENLSPPERQVEQEQVELVSNENSPLEPPGQVETLSDEKATLEQPPQPGSPNPASPDLH